jgi:Zn-dependent M28 family amino/carboxypeptidase
VVLTPPTTRRRIDSRAARAFQQALSTFLVDEGVVAVVTAGRGDDGTVFTGASGSRDPSNPTKVPGLIFSTEHYGRIARMVEKGVPVTVELDVKNTFYDDDQNSFNIVAEIPGTDPKLKDEVVMLGAHFDSWHTGTGATDNAAGSAVMLEALRLIKATGLKPRRTIRIGLWTGEEQGLLGSRAYVKEHFGDPATMQLKQPAQERFAGYFNVDNGTGAIRGVYLQKNEAVAPIFKSWMAAFNDPRLKSVTASNTGGTDHLSFDAVGLPGFQFIQDPVDYGSRTHHSNMDVYERLIPDDMKHNAAVVAAFVYLTANRDQKLPRKPAPTVQ